MENFTFCSPTRYLFGKGVEAETGRLVNEMGAKKVLVVYGGGSAKRSGLLDRVEKSLRDAGVEYTELGGIQPNPVDGPVREGIEIVRREGIDGLLPVGGGSVIDTAKAIAAGALYDGDFWDFFCGKSVVSKALPIGVVLTIPAAGSEGSGNSVITLESERRKISIRTDFWLRPKFAVMNPEVTYTLPQYQTVAGIADMMAHIMERYFTTTEGVETTDRLCEGLLLAIIHSANQVVAQPDDYDARANIMWAGTLAHNGVCGVGRKEDWASHGLEHELSALYGVTHGAGLAVVFPAWMEYMAANRPAKIAQYARRVFGVTEADDFGAALEGVRRLRLFFREIGLPTNLKELGVEHPDFDTLVARFHENKGIPAGSYYPLYPDDTRAIYELMVKGRC
ncbi:MAG: iron-containing alcohol dehydrogenase [Muribaculaceae bacterium]